MIQKLIAWKKDGNNSRKITADYYLDDKVVNMTNMGTIKRNKDGKGIPGKPQYALGDMVDFKFDRGHGKYTMHSGRIVVVDSYGSLEHYMEQPSYDIEGKDESGRCCWFKHVPESDVHRKLLKKESGKLNAGKSDA